MKYNFYNNNEIINILGEKLQAYRISKNISQKELAEKSGINRVSISKIENGSPTSISTLIEIMRALDILDNIDLLFPAVVKSPKEILKEEQKAKKRVRNGNKS